MSPSTLQWLSLVGIIWLQSINGTNTDFPAYSSQLKHLLSISQVQLNNLAFASDAGKLFGWFSGIAAVHLPLWAVLLIGSILGCIGYGVQFLFLVNKISSLSYWQFFLLAILAGNSICWINTVCYMISIRNFKSDRQAAVGLSTSYIGLSAKIYTDFIDAVFPSSPIKKAKAYLLLNSVVPIAVAMVTAPLVREIELEKDKQVEGRLIVMFLITIATGVYALIGSMGSISSGFSPSIRAIGMGALLATPLVIPVVTWVREGLDGKWWTKRVIRVHGLAIDEVGKGERVEIEVKETEGVEIDEVGKGERIEIEVKETKGVEVDGRIRVEEEGEIRVEEEVGVKSMVTRMNFWLYFFVYMFGATLGLVYLNNLGQIAESRGLSKTSSLVSLSSSFGFFGRLMPSLLDYFFSKNRFMGSSRSASIVMLMAPMAGAFFLLVNTTNLSLYVSTAIIGVCSGAITSVSISTTSELFGTKNFSVNHNIVIANIPIGSFLFGYLAALFYQREGNEGHGRCMGVECYRKTFIIWGCICSLGTLLAFILYVRTRKIYCRRF